MAPKHLRGDINYAWPSAEIAVMGAKGAVEIIYRNDIGDEEKINKHTEAYEDRFLNPFVAAERGYFDPSLISEVMDALDTSDKNKIISLTKNLSAADIADIINLIPRHEVKDFTFNFITFYTFINL